MGVHQGLKLHNLWECIKLFFMICDWHPSQDSRKVEKMANIDEYSSFPHDFI